MNKIVKKNCKTFYSVLQRIKLMTGSIGIKKDIT